MKKKVFYQISIILYIILTLLILIFSAAVYVVIWFLFKKISAANVWEWAGFIAAIFVIFFIGYTVIRMTKNRIIFNESEIFVPAHWGSKENKLQYETHIPYSDIQSIYIVSSTRNSLNKSLKWGTLPMPYIVFDCKCEEQKAINTFYFSKNQVIKIIDESILRAKELGNDLSIESGEIILNEFIKNEKRLSKKKK